MPGSGVRPPTFALRPNVYECIACRISGLVRDSNEKVCSIIGVVRGAGESSFMHGD
jgi:hypothetical protein